MKQKENTREEKQKSYEEKKIYRLIENEEKMQQRMKNEQKKEKCTKPDSILKRNTGTRENRTDTKKVK